MMINNTRTNANGQFSGSNAGRVFAALAGVVFSAAFARAEAPPAATVTGHPAEGKLEMFLGEPKLDIQQVYVGNRFPNIVTAVDGTVLALWGGVKVRRSEDAGETWGPEITIASGFMGGGAIVNETNGEILAFVEKHHPPSPLTVYRSKDHGKTWSAMDAAVKPNSKGHVPSMHMNEHGITLRRGKHKGRLLRAARHYAGANHRDNWPKHYTTAIYSDDNGKTWNTSDPFPAFGT
ncbi:MAG: sialidase family protein, partial [Thermoguttaceae bacterium]